MAVPDGHGAGGDASFSARSAVLVEALRGRAASSVRPGMRCPDDCPWRSSTAYNPERAATDRQVDHPLRHDGEALLEDECPVVAEVGAPGAHRTDLCG